MQLSSIHMQGVSRILTLMSNANRTYLNNYGRNPQNYYIYDVFFNIQL